jgi:DNA-binding NarL/FixJ family response regulator
MARLLFLPTRNTLVWLEVHQTPEELLAAIEQGHWIPPPPFEHIPIASLQAVCQGDLVTVTASLPDGIPNVGPRQKEVLVALAEGLTVRQIAYRLKMSPRMVKLHIAELKKKFSSATREELIRKGRFWLENQPCQTGRQT